MSHTLPTTDLYSCAALRLNGQEESLSAYRGKVLLVVNVASQCGFTPQYQGLEALYQRHQQAGLAVLGFPCNQFGAQEQGSAEAIQAFCTLNFNITFPMFAKIEVNGANAHPLYVWLKACKPGLLGIEAIKWNFTKFLVDRQGHVVQRYAPSTKPEAIEADIAALL